MPFTSLIRKFDTDSSLLPQIDTKEYTSKIKTIEKDILLKKDFARLIEMKVDTLFERIRQNKLIEGYLDGEYTDSDNCIVVENEVYKMFGPKHEISPFLFGCEVYIIYNLLKIPMEFQALDMFINRNFKLLSDDVFSKKIPWELFEVIGQRIVDSARFLNEALFEEQRKKLPQATKLLKLYRDYEEENF